MQKTVALCFLATIIAETFALASAQSSVTTPQPGSTAHKAVMDVQRVPVQRALKIPGFCCQTPANPFACETGPGVCPRPISFRMDHMRMGLWGNQSFFGPAAPKNKRQNSCRPKQRKSLCPLFKGHKPCLKC